MAATAGCLTFRSSEMNVVVFDNRVDPACCNHAILTPDLFFNHCGRSKDADPALPEGCR